MNPDPWPVWAVLAVWAVAWLLCIAIWIALGVVLWAVAR